MPSAPTSNRALLFFFLLVLVLCSGCQDKWLRIFLDGVPEPEIQEEAASEQTVQPQAEQPAAQEAKPAIIMASRHPDYVARRCDRCHDIKSVNYLTSEKREICFSCHQREKFEGTFIHGPVAVGDCLVCHHPHESINGKLLQLAGNDLCFKCHRSEKLSQVEEHSRMEDTGCLVCHLPHVSDNRFFLKDSSL